MPTDDRAVGEEVEATDRDQAADVRDEVDHAARDRTDETPFPRDKHLVLVAVAHGPRRAQERLLEHVVEDADPLVAHVDVVAGTPDVECGARLDAEQLARLLLVGVETDVLANGELLLAHICDRGARGRLPGRERRDLVEVRDPAGAAHRRGSGRHRRLPRAEKPTTAP